MNLLLILSFGLLVNGGEFSSKWKQWKELHGKEYSSNEVESLRFKIFEENRIAILKHNEEEQRGLHTYTMEMNQFGDLLLSEINERYTGLKRRIRDENTHIFDESVLTPSYVNWTAKGAVTPVKNQEQCGSCWAFSTTGSIESQIFIHKNKLISLSEQQLVDCSSDYGNHGCNGGLMDNAFKYVIANKGIASEKDYPYKSQVNHCEYKDSMSVASITSYKDVKREDEGQLMIAVSSVGPISIAIDASSNGFNFYSSGVYVDKDCSSSRLTHAVLAVGYGTDKQTGLDYWIVKNSWSDKWGMNGYILMARNRNNMCGVASLASYPVL